MAFHEQLVQILNRPVPLPAVLLTPISLPRVFSEEERQSMEKCFDFLLAWLMPCRGGRPSIGRKSARLFSLEGTIKGVKTGGFCVDGTSFIVDENTFVVGNLKSDAKAKVKGLLMPDGKRVATAIVIREAAAAQQREDVLPY